MSIIKPVKRENPYAQIDNRILNNPELSWKAKGLLSYLLSKPVDWSTRVNDLVKKATDQKASVYSALNELKSAGYVSLQKVYENGKIAGWEYLVFEEPQKKLLTDFQEVENQVIENLFVENLFVENQHDSNIDYTNKDLNNKEITNKYFSDFLSLFNQITKKRCRVLCKKTQRQLTALKKIYTKEELGLAVKNAAESQYHKDTALNHLTPEFITRPDKFEKYLNANGSAKSIPTNAATYPPKTKTADSGGKKSFY